MNATEAQSLLGDKPYRDRLIRALRHTAGLWEAKPDGENTFTNGICYAVSRHEEFKRLSPLRHAAGFDSSCAYRDVDAALTLMQNGWDQGMYELRDYTYDRESWEDRATMCLFMAEWLESEFE